VNGTTALNAVPEIEAVPISDEGLSLSTTEMKCFPSLKPVARLTGEAGNGATGIETMPLISYCLATGDGTTPDEPLSPPEKQPYPSGRSTKSPIKNNTEPLIFF